MAAMLIDQLLKTGLLGTGQVPPVPIDPTLQVDQFFVDDDSTSDESQFLMRIGRFAIYECAGQTLKKIPALPEAPVTNNATTTTALQKILTEALHKENIVLLPEFLGLLRANNQTLPDQLLPAFLEINDHSLRPFIKIVVGSKGEWLSQFNADWSWIKLQLDEQQVDLKQLQTIWDEGTRQQRLAAMEAIRGESPALGRELLEQSFSKEKADDRKQFLLRLSIGLEQDDTAFLTSALSDRSKLVKFEAANLLAKLPHSEIALRHQQRALLLLQKVEASRNALQLACSPPQELPAHWEQDGLSAKPTHKRGQRAFWTEELVSKVSLEFWSEQFEATPTQLLNGILNDDYAHAVITGWTNAVDQRTGHCEQSSWREPLWKYWTAMLQHPQQAVVLQALEQLKTLARGFSQADLERSILLLLQSQPDPANLPIGEVLAWLSGPWSKTFSKEYLRISRTLVGARSDKAVYDWIAASSQAAIFLAPELFEFALAPWKIRDHGVQAWQFMGVEKLLTEFTDRIRRRTNFHQEIQKHLAAT